jgi:hypothetical protein
MIPFWPTATTNCDDAALTPRNADWFDGLIPASGANCFGCGSCGVMQREAF